VNIRTTFSSFWDQYVVEARFAIRGEVEPMGNVALGEFSSLIQKNKDALAPVLQQLLDRLVAGIARPEVGLVAGEHPHDPSPRTTPWRSASTSSPAPRR
jgi:hypothetical protein